MTTSTSRRCARDVIASLDEVDLYVATSPDLVVLVASHFPEVPSHTFGRLFVLLAQVEADTVRRVTAMLRAEGATIPRNRKERRERGRELLLPPGFER